MPRLPVASGRQVVRALERAGFVLDHHTGGHAILWHPERRRSASVPLHGGRDLRPGTLRAIIRQAGLSIEEFDGLLRP